MYDVRVLQYILSHIVALLCAINFSYMITCITKHTFEAKQVYEKNILRNGLRNGLKNGLRNLPTLPTFSSNFCGPVGVKPPTRKESILQRTVRNRKERYICTYTAYVRASSSEVCIGEYMYAIDELQHAHVKCYSSVRVTYLWSVHFVLTLSYLRAQGCGSGTCMNAQDTAHQ
jgi:hypothetical protein